MTETSGAPRAIIVSVIPSLKLFRFSDFALWISRAARRYFFFPSAAGGLAVCW